MHDHGGFEVKLKNLIGKWIRFFDKPGSTCVYVKLHDVTPYGVLVEPIECSGIVEFHQWSKFENFDYSPKIDKECQEESE